MDVIILAAGYATRLYPLTLDRAKPLLEVAGKPMIEWVLDNLANVPGLGTIYIVTNDKFANDFQTWTDRYQHRQSELKFKVINDGSKSDDDKLGAIGDINFVITRESLSKSDLLIVAGDNLFSESLAGFVEYANKTEATVAVYDVGDLKKIKKYGNITIDSHGVITHFEEKPEKPYYYSREIIPLVTTYLAAGNNPDQPGRFVQWLYTRKPVKTFQIKGKWLDIGSKETLEEANGIFAEIKT
ncbi:MAG: nucleoside-diphosphate-sugar pyrophosphorylase [Verrucomicrobia bacterium]|nr:MAG: nucleoside-diphosphate-sugar pyrophosphorylase [Verrucomicrobiota bacterium]